MATIPAELIPVLFCNPLISCILVHFVSALCAFPANFLHQLVPMSLLLLLVHIHIRLLKIC